MGENFINKSINFSHSLDNIPNSIKKLSIYGKNYFGDKNSILQDIIYDTKLNTIIKNEYGEIIGIEFHDNFYQSVGGENLPQTLTYLGLGKNFSQKLTNLPNSLTHIKLNMERYCYINSLPNSLTHLEIGDKFMQRFNKLSDNLEQITICNEFQKRLFANAKCIRDYKINIKLEQSDEDVSDDE